MFALLLMELPHSALQPSRAGDKVMTTHIQSSLVGQTLLMIPVVFNYSQLSWYPWGQSAVNR